METGNHDSVRSIPGMWQGETASLCRLDHFCRDVAETQLDSNARFRDATTTKSITLE